MRYAMLIMMVGLLGVGGCSTQSKVQRKAVNEVDDIIESVFRYQFKYNYAGIGGTANGFYLLVYKKDPTSDFVKRFKGYLPEVKKGSAFKKGSGVLFQVGKIQAVSDNKVKVAGGYYLNDTHATAGIYTVERAGRRWLVTKYDDMWKK